MNRRLSSLTLIALALALFAGTASAEPRAPWNGPEYSCGNAGGWNTLRFDLPRRGPDRRGIVYKNGDNRKAVLVAKNNVWEFTFVNDVQCKELTVYNYPGQGESELQFKRCTDGINRTCNFP